MPAAKDDLTYEFVASILDYDPDAGVFRWKCRAVDMFVDGKHSAEHQCKRWNSTFAGKITGSPDKRGYKRICIFNKWYLAHRLAWLLLYGEWPIDKIDHHDTNPMNNASGNLREADNAKNGRNRGMNKNNTSGFKGVSYNKRNGCYDARIMVDGTQICLGATFKTAEEAAAAYSDAAIKYHGEFARTV